MTEHVREYPLHVQHSRCPWNTEFRWAYFEWALSQTPGSSSLRCFIYDCVSRDMHSPSRLHFLFEPELSLSEEGRRRHSKKHKWPRNPIISFLVHVTSQSYPTTYTDDNDVEGKEKLEQPLAPFPLWSSFLSKELNEGRAWVECVHISCSMFVVLMGKK